MRHSHGGTACGSAPPYFPVSLEERGMWFRNAQGVQLLDKCSHIVRRRMMLMALPVGELHVVRELRRNR